MGVLSVLFFPSTYVKEPLTLDEWYSRVMNSKMPLTVLSACIVNGFAQGTALVSDVALIKQLYELEIFIRTQARLKLTNKKKIWESTGATSLEVNEEMKKLFEEMTGQAVMMRRLILEWSLHVENLLALACISDRIRVVIGDALSVVSNQRGPTLRSTELIIQNKKHLD